jgi:hypothetical protein
LALRARETELLPRRCAETFRLVVEAPRTTCIFIAIALTFALAFAFALALAFAFAFAFALALAFAFAFAFTFALAFALAFAFALTFGRSVVTVVFVVLAEACDGTARDRKGPQGKKNAAQRRTDE